MPYIEPLFRPPSEARSLILQVTNGCSWNRCTFCEMYTQPQKRFRLKPQAEIEGELDALQRAGASPRRVFLADGDAMTLSVRRLSRPAELGLQIHLASATSRNSSLDATEWRNARAAITDVSISTRCPSPYSFSSGVTHRQTCCPL